MSTSPTQPEILNALLVGVQLPDTSDVEQASSLQELSRLVTTLGYKVVGRMTQRRGKSTKATVLGEGKLLELAQWTGGTGKVAATFEKKKSKAAMKFAKNQTSEDETEEDEAFDDENAIEEIDTELQAAPTERAQVIIFDCELSPSQMRNLESASGATVLDRTGVIIEIFSRHARTRAAKLQVEIARLNYVAPRLRETGGGADRGGGGVGAKGSGETDLELDRRRIRDRIKELKVELETVAGEYNIRRARRSEETTVALVGYTNAGKSSLMRKLTSSEVYVADKLFATLDTTVRALQPETQPRVLISDTVGFIKKLPHDLVASFRSTLDEALGASLLLHVVDASDPTFRSQMQVTIDVLTEIGAHEVPSRLVLNKRDLVGIDDTEKLKAEFPDAIFISTRAQEDLVSLRTQIIDFFAKDMVEEDLFIAYTKQGAIGQIREQMQVLKESYNENGVTLHVRSKPEDLARLKRRFEL